MSKRVQGPHLRHSIPWRKLITYMFMRTTCAELVCFSKQHWNQEALSCTCQQGLLNWKLLLHVR